MGKTFSEIDDTLRNFVERQHLFFVATAPSSLDGHVNCSPKGLDTLRVLGPTTIAYLDYSGSGAETIAHVRENGRIVIMLCAFEGAPKIVRFHGRGEVIEVGDAEFASSLRHFEPQVGARSIIRVEVDRISDSCGFGVPLMEFQGERTQLVTWAAKKGAAGMEVYRRQKNTVSIDGIPALSFADSETTR
jgi:hypothetical protein